MQPLNLSRSAIAARDGGVASVPTRIDPRQANSLGVAALKAGDFAAAVGHFSGALESDPGAISLWRNLAHAHRELGDGVGERAALDAALDIDRADFTTWLRLAQLHERLGEDREAMVAWAGALQMADAMIPPPDGLTDILDHGRAYCDGQRARLRSVIDSGIGDQLSAMDQRDSRRARAFVDHALGGRPIYANQCAGLYYPFLPADEFFDDFHFPWFADLAAATPDIRREFIALMADPGEALRPYVRQDAGTPANKWSPLDNRLDWGACFLWEYGAPNQPVLDRCPATALALAAAPTSYVPSRAPNAFFSILQPHTRIPPHTGVTNTRAIIHLPLIVPAGCGFRVGGEVRQWVEGQAFGFDDTIDHEAWNDSDKLRAVLIFDVWNPHLTEAEQNLICQYYASADEGG